MAAQIIELLFKVLLLFMCFFVSTILGQTLLNCETSSPDAFGYPCNEYKSLKRCGTFVILRTNSYFSSLLNLSFYLNINRFVIAQANGFSAETEFLHKDQPLLIPIECKCNGGLFHSELTKTTVKGESFYEIAQSFEGLTTSKAIKERNPGVSPFHIEDKVTISIPLHCACPSFEGGSPSKLLLTYPVKQGDKISSLASQFNITEEAIVSANIISIRSLRREVLIPLTSILIPLNREPILGPLAKSSELNLHFPTKNIPVISPHRKRKKMRKIGLYIAISGIIIGVSIAIVAAFMVIQLKKKKQIPLKGGVQDLELQQLSLSVRTTSDKKVSFEGSQDPFDQSQVINTTPRNLLVENYNVDELRKATEDFNSSNHIEGSVYHGRLNGKNLAIIRIKPNMISKIDFALLHDAAVHHHPNIISLLGTCLTEGLDSFLVFEYARNGSLKDWLHGVLAIKNQFIASCYCFLTWNQRLKICLDVAMALKHMHHKMEPSYIHRHIKSRNIFLDEEFNAKIGSFGLARCAEDDIEGPLYSSNPTTWGLGYLAPEFVHQGVISASLDIFAYGVVLLEILSGKTPISRPDEKGGGSVWLSEKIRCLLKSENADELKEWMDNALGDNYSFDSAVTLVNLARVCTEEDPSLRPNAEEIVEKMSRMVEESNEGEQSLTSESSSKPLVKAAATIM